MSIIPRVLLEGEVSPTQIQNPDRLGQILSIVIGVIGFILFMIISYLILKWLSTKSFSGSGTGHMKILDRLMISKDSCFIILQVGVRVFVVSVSRENSTLLCEISPNDIPQKQSDVTGGFGKRFAHNLKVNMGLKPKGTPPIGPATKTSEPSPQEVGMQFQAVLERIQQQTENPVFSHQKNGGESGRSYAENATVMPPVPPSVPRETAPPVGYGGREQTSPGQSYRQKPQVNQQRLDYETAIENMTQASKRVNNPPVQEIRTSRNPYENIASVKHSSNPESDGVTFSRSTPPAAPPVKEQASETPKQSGYAAEAEKPVLVDTNSESDDQIDKMFDLISKRQGRYNRKKEKE